MRKVMSFIVFRRPNIAEFMGYFFYDAAFGKSHLVRTSDGIYLPVYKNLPRDRALREIVIDRARSSFERDRCSRSRCFTYSSQYTITNEGFEVLVGRNNGSEQGL